MKPTVYNSTSNPIVTMNFEVSTGHITAHDNRLLKKAVKDPQAPIIVYTYREGYFVYVPTSKDQVAEIPSIKAYGFSDALVNLLRETARLKCKYLQLDSDAMEYENFPTFEW
jgi:hypothetical protein